MQPKDRVKTSRIVYSSPGVCIPKGSAGTIFSVHSDFGPGHVREFDVKMDGKKDFLIFKETELEKESK